MKSYQITQERYSECCIAPTQDFWPVHFSTVEEAQAAVKRQGLKNMFEHEGDSHYIAELGADMVYTGKTFKIEE